MAKQKMTGFARLLLFLIIFLPLAFAGASYINNEDPIQKAKEYLGLENTSSIERSQNDAIDRNVGSSRQVDQLERKILELEKDLAVANEKLARCQLEQQQNQ
ncbi:MAG: hypothetical protein AAFQ37_12895 [Bacteroidota bacterium]